jgi:hypothetical protein
MTRSAATLHRPPAMAESIERCEFAIGRPIPSPYRTLLLRHDGGKPRPADFDFVQRGRTQGSRVDGFFSVDARADGASSIQFNVEVLRDRIPADLFPIADDVCGNLLLIGDDNTANAGKIFFWDHEHEVEEGETPDYRNVWFVAESLDAFLASLMDAPKPA